MTYYLLYFLCLSFYSMSTNMQSFLQYNFMSYIYNNQTTSEIIHKIITDQKLMFSLLHNSDQNSGKSEYHSIDEGSDKETCYVSLFQVCMNYLFPREFPMPSTIYRFKVKGDRSVSNTKKKIIGKILSPVGRCSKFPKGIFVQSPSEELVKKIYCPGAKDKYLCRNNK